LILHVDYAAQHIASHVSSIAKITATTSNTQIANTTPLLDCQRQHRGAARW
jgi:hypothetical protein